MHTHRQIYKGINMTEEKLKQFIAERRVSEHPETGCLEPSPFKVPEGYFDTLCDSIMDKLPTAEVSKKPRYMKLSRHFLEHAAALLFAIGTISLAIYESSINTPIGSSICKDHSNPVSIAITDDIIESYQDDNYVDDALDYAMIENNEIAAYLTGY